MSDSSNQKIEIKSVRARRVLGQIPPFIVRMGILCLAVIFILSVVLASLIQIEPLLNVEVVISSNANNEVEGYALLPNKRVISAEPTVPLNFEFGYADVLPKCVISLESGKNYVKNSVIYLAMSVEAVEKNDNLIIDGTVYTNASIQLSKRSLLQWFLYKYINNSELVIH